MAAAQPRFVLPLAQVAPVAQLEAWLARADAGDEVSYAVGIDPPRGEPGFCLIQRWAERGIVLPARRPHPEARGFFEFIVQRTSRPLAGGAGGEDRGGPVREQLRAVLRRLRIAAERGAVCPTYSDLAEAIGLRPDSRGKRRVRTLLVRLERERRIAVQPGDATRPPVVTIVARGRGCGKSTKGVSV